jgi:hypothetical protein
MLYAVLEAPTLVAGLDVIAMVSQAIELGGDQQRGVLIEFADQAVQQLSARLTERQMAELVDGEQGLRYGRPSTLAALRLTTSLYLFGA